MGHVYVIGVIVGEFRVRCFGKDQRSLVTARAFRTDFKAGAFAGGFRIGTGIGIGDANRKIVGDPAPIALRRADQFNRSGANVKYVASCAT